MASSSSVRKRSSIVQKTTTHPIWSEHYNVGDTFRFKPPGVFVETQEKLGMITEVSWARQCITFVVIDERLQSIPFAGPDKRPRIPDHEQLKAEIVEFPHEVDLYTTWFSLKKAVSILPIAEKHELDGLLPTTRILFQDELIEDQDKLRAAIVEANSLSGRPYEGRKQMANRFGIVTGVDANYIYVVKVLAANNATHKHVTVQWNNRGKHTVIDRRKLGSIRLVVLLERNNHTTFYTRDVTKQIPPVPTALWDNIELGERIMFLDRERTNQNQFGTVRMIDDNKNGIVVSMMECEDTRDRTTLTVNWTQEVRKVIIARTDPGARFMKLSLISVKKGGEEDDAT